MNKQGNKTLPVHKGKTNALKHEGPSAVKKPFPDGAVRPQTKASGKKSSSFGDRIGLTHTDGPRRP